MKEERKVGRKTERERKYSTKKQWKTKYILYGSALFLEI
jgi:hypothetical protein